MSTIWLFHNMKYYRYMTQASRNQFTTSLISNVIWINYIDGTPADIGLLGHTVSKTNRLFYLKR